MECTARGHLEPRDACPPTALGSLRHGVSGERKGSGRHGFQSLRQELCPEGSSLGAVSRARDLLFRVGAWKGRRASRLDCARQLELQNVGQMMEVGSLAGNELGLPSSPWRLKEIITAAMINIIIKTS